MEKKTLLQENVQTLAQAKEEEQYCKAKNDVRASMGQRRMSIGLDYTIRMGLSWKP